MKKSFLFLYFSLCILNYAISQTALVTMWDYRFGGYSNDWLTCIKQTQDRGFILGGWSASGVGADKTQPLVSYPDMDYWIIKTDSQGNKLWDKDFGGSAKDYLYSIDQTSDGGYIL